MREIILQGKKDNTLIVDALMSPIGYTSYEEAKTQKILYIMIHILFIHQDMLFIRETKKSQWCLSSMYPLLYGLSKEENIEHIMNKEFGVRGIHITQLSTRKRENISYFELYCTVKISYVLTKDITVHGNFINITLLKQLLLLDKQAYTNELHYGIQCLG
ncbi:MAG: hypothetical protein ACRCV3_04300 [Desulfovibrionaceae bacterium]